MGMLRAIWYKEWMSFKQRLMFSLGFSVTLVIIGAFRPTLDARYISILVGLATALMSLKFWEERGQGTLDTLLALPTSARRIFLAKSSFSCAVGLIFSAVTLACQALIDVYRGHTVGASYLVALPVVAAVTFGACNIAGYVMWSLSEQAAKIAQIMMLVVLTSGFASAFGTGLNVAIVLAISAVTLVSGFVCVSLINVERIVLNLD